MKKQRKADVFKALPIVAASMGRKFGVRVLFQGSTAMTDGNVIYLPTMTEASEHIDALWGYLAHESAHVRFTNFDALREQGKRSPIEKNIHNILEDGVIEREIMRVFPGTVSSLRDTCQHLIDHELWMDADDFDKKGMATPPEHTLTGYILFRIRCDAGLSDQADLLQGYLDRFESRFRNTFSQAVQSGLDDILDRAHLNADTADTLAMTAEIMDFLQLSSEDQGDSDDTDGSSSQGGDSQDDDESDDQGGGDSQDSSDQSESDDDADGDDSSDQSGSDGDDDADGDDSSDQSGSDGDDDADGDDSSDQSGSDGDDDADGDDSSSQSGSDGDDDADGDDSSSQSGSDGDDDDSAGSSGEEGDDADSDTSGSSSNGDAKGGDDASTSPDQRKSLQDALASEDDDAMAGDVLKPLSEAMEEEAKKTASTSMGSSAQTTQVAASYGVNPDEAADFVAAGADLDLEARRVTRKLRQQLTGLVQASRSSRPYATRRGRKMSTGRLTRLKTGDTRVFNREDHQTEPDTAIHLLVDRSGSMSGAKAEMAGQATYALAIALESIEGVKVSASSFGGQPIQNLHQRVDENPVKTILTASQTARRAPGRFVVRPEGLTPLAPGIWSAISAFREATAERQVLIVLTDGGASDYEPASEVMNQARRQGVEVYGIGIEVLANPELFDDSALITELSRLGPELFQLARKRIFAA